jgi:hypothetical protein
MSYGLPRKDKWKDRPGVWAERFERYGWAQFVGVLRFAKDDSKNGQQRQRQEQTTATARTDNGNGKGDVLAGSQLVAVGEL